MPQNLNELISKFHLGQRVKKYDSDEFKTVYGKVTKIFDESLYVKWDDLMTETRHDDADDIETIKDASPVRG